MTTPPFQPMPPLTSEQYIALEADIAEHGVIVAVVLDQHGRVLDGHNRKRIAERSGIDYPTEIREVDNDADAMSMAVILNCARRHLSGEQKRALIAAELVRCGEDSDRAIARRVGCSPSTVGAVRAERREAHEQRIKQLHSDMGAAATAMFSACHDMTLMGVEIGDLIERAKIARDDANATIRRRGMAAFVDEDTSDLIDNYVYTCLVNDLSDLSDMLDASGWEKGEIRPTLLAAELESLTAALFPLSRLDTQPAEAVAR